MVASYASHPASPHAWRQGSGPSIRTSAAQHEFDVLVIGGGMVGAVLCVALDQAGFSVGLVEAKRPAAFFADSDYDLRVSAVSPASRRLLENLGLWAQVAGTRISPYRGMRVWDAGGRALLEFEHTALGLPELGHIVENNLVVDSAWAALGNTRTFCPAKLTGLRVEPQHACADLDDGTQLRAKLIIGAEGAGSPVRQMSGIRTTGWAYGQRCTVGSVTTELSHQAIAWQRYLPTGPVAFLPLADGRCSLAWHADEPLANELASLDDAEFCRRLTAASDGVLGEIQAIGKHAAFPLRLMHADEYVRPRIALAGDAAHVLHPMAGQGVNLGLLDVAVLTQVLARGRNAGRDLGDLALLKRYQRARKTDNLIMMAATDGIKRLFGTDTPMFAKLRDRGIAAVDAFSPLKQIMIRQAAGLTGDPPPLLR